MGKKQSTSSSSNANARAAYDEVRLLMAEARARAGDMGGLGDDGLTILCCPNCGAQVGFRRVPPRLKCPICGRVAEAAIWRDCVTTYDNNGTYVARRRGWGGRARGGGHHGGHHGHHGFGSLGDSTPALSPLPTPGAPDEQTQLLRRVAEAQEAFNKQDMTMRRYTLAATVGLPVLAAMWGQITKWWKSKKALPQAKL